MRGGGKHARARGTTRARRRLRPRTLVALALMGLLAGCLPAGTEKVPYRMDASNQAGWWKPIAELNGNVYVAFDGWGSSTAGGADDTHTVYIARRDPQGHWTRGCLPANGSCAVYVDDIGHRQPTIAIDGDGYIHAFVAMHNDNWRYFRSSRPGDPTSMVDRSGEMPDQGGDYTYPTAGRTPNGDVYMLIRAYPDGMLYRWDDAANRWSTVATVAAEPGYVVYPDDVVGDAQGNVHIVWEWAYGGPNGLRHLGSYLRYEPATGGFSDAAGRSVRTPAGIDSSAVFQPLEGDELSTDRGSPADPPGFQSAKLTIDQSTGRPVIGYRYRPVTGGLLTVREAEWTGRGWDRQVVYAGRYNTSAAIDVTVHGGVRNVYYAKMDVPSDTQAFAASRAADGTWVEAPSLLPGVPVERLSVVQAGPIDHLYLASPDTRELYVQRRRVG